MDWLTPAERRGAALLVALLLIGAGWDMWRAGREAATVARPALALETLPARTEAPPAPGGGQDTTATTATSPPGEPLDLNRAGPAELDALPGIGPVLAGRILEQRRAHGPFRRLEDLLAVRGVGPRLLERLRPHVRAGGADAGPAPTMQSAPRGPGKRADSTSVEPEPSR